MNEEESGSFWNLTTTAHAVAIGIAVIGIIAAVITISDNLDIATTLDNQE